MRGEDASPDGTERERSSGLSCPSCGLRFEGASPPAPGEPLRECVICGNRELYIQKDFNRALGLGIVAVSFLAIFLVMVLVDHRTGIYCLFGLAIADWIAYRLLREVTVCYLCQSVYRGAPLNPDHRGFYLGSEEKYKHLRPAWLDRMAPGRRGRARHDGEVHAAP